MTSIPVALGIGSGIDTAALVTQLVDAQFANKTKLITGRQETVEAQISAISQLRSNLNGFSLALSNLIAGGSLSTQPISADTSVVAASLLPGARIAGLSAEVEVQQLATAQVVTSAPIADRTAPVGKGTLTITLGTTSWTGDVPTGFTPKAGATPIAVTIGDADNSLNGIANAINAARAGVTATVVSDVNGARLSIKGATGAEQSFTIDVVEDPAAPGLSAFTFNTSSQALSLTRKAVDAVIAVDGVALRRPTNSVSDVLTGVKLDLVKAAPGQTIAITTSPPTAGLSQAMTDIVDTYNELLNAAKQDTNATTGVLRSDAGAREMLRLLGKLTNRDLNPDGAPGEPRTLAELGVRTNRDGTLTLDTGQLSRVLAANGPAVERMLTGALGQALRQISIDLTSRGGGLTASEAGYNRLKTQLARQQEAITLQVADMRERLTRQFAGMDARVSAYKATQSFLEQQIKSWTADR
jgi:flagellar hook-associated protein 2